MIHHLEITIIVIIIVLFHRFRESKNALARRWPIQNGGRGIFIIADRILAHLRAESRDVTDIFVRRAWKIHSDELHEQTNTNETSTRRTFVAITESNKSIDITARFNQLSLP